MCDCLGAELAVMKGTFAAPLACPRAGVPLLSRAPLCPETPVGSPRLSPAVPTGCVGALLQKGKSNSFPMPEIRQG